MSEVLSALHERLRILEDKEAIRSLLATIARATDRYDGDLLKAAIDADAVMDMGGKKLTGSTFAQAMKPPAAPRPGRMHVLGNERIDVDGDSAWSETYLISCQDVLTDGVRKTRVRAGRYIDRFERRGGQWKLTARTMIDEWGRIDPVGEAIDGSGHSGKPAPHDISYHL